MQLTRWEAIERRVSELLDGEPAAVSDLMPLCFVLMPFGLKPDPTGRPPIDFDRVYDAAIAPAIMDAGLLPVRADEEKAGGITHRAMFERLLRRAFRGEA